MDARGDGLRHQARAIAIQNVLRDHALESAEVVVPMGRYPPERRRVYNIEPEAPYQAGRWTIYPLRILNTRIVRDLKSDRVAQAMAVALNTRGVVIDIDGDTALVKVPEAGGAVLPYAEALALDPSPPSGVLVIGREVASGRQFAIDTNRPGNVHVLVIGSSGSGKSTTMRTLIYGALAQGVSVALFDPRANGAGVESMRSLSGHPCVWRGGIWDTPARCEQGLGCLARAVERGEALGHLLVFVDEVPSLVEERPGVRALLGVLAASGRHSGIHLYLGAQHVLTEHVGSLTGVNAPARLIHRVTSRMAAYQAAGDALASARRLQTGELYAVNGAGEWHVQAAVVPNEELARFAQRYPPRVAREPVTEPVAIEGPPGVLGRPRDDIEQDVIDEIRRWQAENGEWPSLNYIYRWTRRRYGSGYGREKQQAALDLAQMRAVEDREVTP